MSAIGEQILIYILQSIDKVVIKLDINDTLH